MDFIGTECIREPRQTFVRFYGMAMLAFAAATLFGSETVLAADVTGSVSREYWTGVYGSTVKDLMQHADYPARPDGKSTLKSFEIPLNFANNYGTRVRGYVHPPVSGIYTFWIASNNNGSLRLSYDDKPANAREIASVPSNVSSRQWSTYPSQKSSSIYLRAGRRYYIEAIHKESRGDDHMSVAWKGGGLNQQVIAGKYLSPWISAPEVPVGIPGDADGDGLPDSWEKQYGLNPYIAGDASRDSDGDGASNLQEFQAGSNPTSKTSTPTIGSVKLAWNAPLRWTDGSTLYTYQLAGYRVRWGTAPGQYSHSATLTDPGVTHFTVGQLKRNARYYFTVTALGTDGRESDYSDEQSGPARN